MRTLTLVLPLLLVPALASSQTPDAKKAAIAYLRGLQNENGGFSATAKAPPTLGATSAAVRALKYLGGEVPSPDGAHKFLVSCFDKETGGCSDTPGGKTDVRSTAVGIMLAVELGLPVEKYEPLLIQYLSDNAKDFEGIRIAVAGLEALKKASPKAAGWQQQVEALANPDGTFGTGAGAARDTGGSAVILLRLGLKLKNEAAVLKVLEDGLRADGGYGKADAKGSDLEATYRVMRCYYMLKKQPTGADKIRAFVAKCQNPDGGFGISPGQPSNASGTYFASILNKWLDSK